MMGQHEGQCWGRVDLEDYAEDGSAIHACRGHQNYWDWCNGADVRKYIPENAGADGRGATGQPMTETE